MCVVMKIFYYCPEGDKGNESCPYFNKETKTCSPWDTGKLPGMCCDPENCGGCMTCPSLQESGRMVNTVHCPDCAIWASLADACAE